MFELDEARSLIAKAGMQSFRKTGSAYAAASDSLYPVEKLAIARIEPIVRGPGIHTFVEDRALAILRAIHSNDLLPPVLVYAGSTSHYDYKLYDGFHRYYLSLALGFEEIFAGVNPWNPNDAV